jgi:hypothetical protein
MSVDRYLAGNKVYRSGSSAPTMGTVDPSGYVERELRNRNMQSQTRSGLAAAALDRLRTMGRSPVGESLHPPGQANGWAGQGHFGGTEGPINSSAPTGNEGTDRSVYFNALQHTLQAKLAAAHAEHANGLAQMQAQDAGRPTVSPIGKIQAPTGMDSGGFRMPSHMQNQTINPGAGALQSETQVASAPVSHPASAPAPASHPLTVPTNVPPQQGVRAYPQEAINVSALPFDYQGTTDSIQAANDYGMLINQLMASRQGAQRDYVTGMHQLDEQQPQDERSILNQFAGRGLAHSSGYGVGYGNLENQYAGERSGLANTLAQLLSQYGNQEAQGNATYNQTLAAIKAAIAQRLAAQAGSLGLK